LNTKATEPDERLERTQREQRQAESTAERRQNNDTKGLKEFELSYQKNR
jgi:hypothetical protein